MDARQLWKRLAGLRALGPYILIELLLPGGTLLAFLLWLSQRLKCTGFGSVQRPSRAATEIAAPPHALPSPAGSSY